MSDLLPPCYGVLWQGIEGSFCLDVCQVSDPCFMEFVTGPVLESLERMGGQAGSADLAADLRVPVEAMDRALAIVDAHRPAELEPEPKPAKKPKKTKKPRKRSGPKKPARKPKKPAKKRPAKKRKPTKPKKKPARKRS